MATQLVNVGDLFDTSAFGNNSYVDEVVPLKGGGYTLVIGQNIVGTTPMQGLARQTSLVTVDANGAVVGSPIKLGHVDIDKAQAQADGSLLVALRSPDGKSESLATISKTGVLKTFYDTSLSSTTKDGYGVPDSSVAFGKDGTIALAKLATDKTGPYRIVDIMNANRKLVASVTVDQSVASDEAGSTGVTALEDGRFLVTWTEQTKTGADVMARIVTKDGKLVGSAFVAAHADDLGTPAKTSLRYDVSALAGGGFAIGFQSGEYYSDPASGNFGASVDGKIQGIVWNTNKSGTFTVGAAHTTSTLSKSAYFVGLEVLSDGRILEVVQDNLASSGTAGQSIVKGYLYGSDGKSSGESVDLFSSVNTNSRFTDVDFLQALSNGNFVLGLDFTKTTTGAGYSWNSIGAIQTYGFSSAGYVAVKGGTSGNDVLKGQAGGHRAETIDGLAGNDRLYGFGGNDRLFGGAGDDYLDGGKGGDRMEGGAGNDTYAVDNLGDFVIEARGAGIDTVEASVGYGLADNVERLVLTGGKAIDGLGNALDNVLTGNKAANDLDGGAGADIMQGGAGDDTYHVDNGRDRVIERAKEGTDTVIAGVSFTLADNQSVEVLVAQGAFLPGSKAVNLTGNGLANTLKGDFGANVLNGKGGADVLTGNFGSDTFVFDTALGNGNVDRITDFQGSLGFMGDRIQLDNAIFKNLIDGSLAPNAFKNTAFGAVDADDRILYDAKTGSLSYDADGSGAAKAVQFAVLGEAGAKVYPNLTASDFFVV